MALNLQLFSAKCQEQIEALRKRHVSRNLKRRPAGDKIKTSNELRQAYECQTDALDS